MLKSLKKNFVSSKYSDVNKMMVLRNSIKKERGISQILKKRNYQRYCTHFGCFIPSSTSIGEGIVFPHGPYGVFISQGAVIGMNCTIFQQVTIGSNTLQDSEGVGSPSLGDNVYIGAGAKIIGNVCIGNNVRIGANAIVVKDVPDNSTVVMQEAVVIEHNEMRDNHFVKYSL